MARYKHDCTTCLFLATVKNEEEDAKTKTVDLYIHMDDEVHKDGRTFIARYSSDGPDYSSGSTFCWSNPYLNKALRLAFGKGLLKGDLHANLMREQARWVKYCEEDADYKKRIDERFIEERFFLPNYASN